MRQKAGKSRIIKVLGQEVDETKLQTSLRDVLAKRGLTAHLIVEDERERKLGLGKPGIVGQEYLDYGNVYKYAFF
jgi:hypothetical protein